MTSLSTQVVEISGYAYRNIMFTTSSATAGLQQHRCDDSTYLKTAHYA